jgi:radical SAM protein with 4Fe4S-binding SPASM domain
MEKSGGFIASDFCERIMREAFDEGVRELGMFINGEPFTNPALGTYIRLAKQIGYEYVYVTTNGALANPERLREVTDAGLDSIKYSINAGTKESYMKIHGCDDFEKVIGNLKYAREYREASGKRYNIFGSFVVTNPTAQETESFKRQYASLFDDFAFYKVRGNGAMRENTERIAGEFTSQKCCTLPFNTINIDYDGSLLACCEDINHKIPISNLNKIPLKDAWYCDEMKRLRQAHIDRNLSGTVCEECLAGGGGVVEVVNV